MPGRYRPPSHDNRFSMAAAESVEESSLRQRDRVFAFIAAHQPVAQWQAVRAGVVGENSVHARFRELMDDRRIEQRGQGITPAGRSCGLYRVLERQPTATPQLPPTPTCNFELPASAKRYVPHVMRRRPDGSEVCGTCHPGTVAPTVAARRPKMTGEEIDAYIARGLQRLWEPAGAPRTGDSLMVDANVHPRPKPRLWGFDDGE